MENRLIIFEDDKYEQFYPLTHLRPVYFLRPGIRSLSEILIDSFPDYQPILICRPELEGIVSESTGVPVNKFENKKFDEIIFINGRMKLDPNFAQALKSANKNAFLLSGDELAAIKIMGGLTPEESAALAAGELGEFARKIRQRSEVLDVKVKYYNYLWELVDVIGESIYNDFNHLRKQTAGRIAEVQKSLNGRLSSDLYPGVYFRRSEEIYLAADAQILPGAVLDAEKGPIFIGTGVKVEPNAYIMGPVYVGKESIIVGGRISDSSIGPVSRVGGELEQSIIQGYSNKWHAGYIGHSYIGEWVNLGAMTTNSDLKNNYGSVRVSVNGKEIDTGMMKVGSFIGDYTRTAIGTLLNTGINVGVCCNLLGDGLINEKELNSFTWYSSGEKIEYKLPKALETIERVMGRRDKKLSDFLRRRLSELTRGKAKISLE